MADRPLSMCADLIAGYACVKQAATRADAEVGALDIDRAELIDRACDDLREGRLHDPVVVAIVKNTAGESTDDIYRTAFKIGLCFSIERLLTSLGQLAQACRTKGRELAAFSVALTEDRYALQSVRTRLWEVNVGAPTEDAGVPERPEYALTVCRHLAAITGYDIVTAPAPVDATADVGVFTELSSMLKRSATKLSCICSSILPGMVHAFEPARAQILFEDLQWMTAAVDTLRTTALHQPETA